MPKYLIIDGYNAISKIREFDLKKDISLEVARLSFIKMLQEFMLKKRVFDKILVVFDSKEKALGVRKHVYGNVEAHFATYDRDADNVIVDMLRAATPKDEIIVCSDDNFIRNHARAFSREALSIKEFQGIIMLKPKPFSSKIEHEGIEKQKIKDINEELKKHWRIE